MTLLRRLLAALLALALAALAVLVLVEAVGIRTGESPVLLPLDDWERELTDGAWSDWRDDAWTVTSGIVLAVGVVLLLLQLVPHRLQALDRHRAGTDDGPDVRFGRGGLEDRLHDVTVDRSDVVGASVKVRRRRIRVEATVPQGLDRAPVRDDVREALAHEIDRLRLERRPRLRVGVAHGTERVV